MTTYYYNKQNEMLDYIYWKPYGFTEKGRVELVLETNTGLAECGSFLSAGLKITLPEIQQPLEKIDFENLEINETRLLY